MLKPATRIHRFRGTFFYERIAAHYDESTFSPRRIFDDIKPRIEEITRTFGQLIPRAAEMNIEYAEPS